MSKKRKVTKANLTAIIYKSIFNIANDNTGHASYRKYFDKVINDIFDYEGLITEFMMSQNMHNCIEDMLKDSDMHQFCQMLLREEDVNTVKDLVRVAYDAAQIANKPKKCISTSDIKSYRYLMDLYFKGIKAMRKKYNNFNDNKKIYKTKYSSLNATLNHKHKSKDNYEFNLFYDDDEDDESFDDIFVDDDEDEDESFDGIEEFDTDFENMIPTDDRIDNMTNANAFHRMIFDTSGDIPTENTLRPEVCYDEGFMSQADFQKQMIIFFDSIDRRLENVETNITPQVINRYCNGDTDTNITNTSIDDIIDYNATVENYHADTVQIASDEKIHTEVSMEDAAEESTQAKSYDNMTREECINEFNSITSTTSPEPSHNEEVAKEK